MLYPLCSKLRNHIVTHQDVQHTVDHLHLRGCIDRAEWSHDIEVPEGGIFIRPDPGDVLRYLQRYVGLAK